MSLKQSLLDFGALGDRPDDPPESQLEHRFLIYMGVLMSGGGILWGSIAAYFELLLPAIVPYSYVVLTVLNLGYFKASKNFKPVRFFQVLISLLLPFLFQWTLGGFEASGGVMLWAMLSLVGSLTFTDNKSGVRWLVLYAFFTVLSGLIDAEVAARFSNNPTAEIRTMFFTINITVISSIVFGLMIYLQVKREAANSELKDANARIATLNEDLEDQVVARTKELRSALGKFETILNNLADGLLAVDCDGVITANNPIFKELLFIEKEIEGLEASDAIPLELKTLAKSSCDDNEVKRIEVDLPGDRIGKAVASPIQSDGVEGNEGAVVILRDITLEKEVDRMKTDFIATVSHELRTPLTSVLGFAKLTRKTLENQILQYVPEDDKRSARAAKKVTGNIDIIISEGERLTNLINDVLDISKMEAGHMEWRMEPLDPLALIQRASEASTGLFTNDALKLVVDIPDDLPAIQGDHDRLLQVLINMLSNASKFTLRGSVTISAKVTAEGVEFSVADTGEGIDPADLATVFEKFRQVGDTLTNKPQGTGLGLPICRQIIQSHGGRIWGESELGKGSTFRFVIPSSFVPVEESRATMETIVDHIDRHVQLSSDPSDIDVLVVDDDPSLRELVRQQLTERGYKVRLAENGYEAIQAARAQSPDLVILDVMMPDFSGFDVAAVLKSDPETHQVPIIILSIIQDKDRGYRLGVESYLTKPTDSDALITEIERVLTRSKTRKTMLVVNPDPLLDYQKLEARGYVVTGTCKDEDCLVEASKIRPDVIIFGQKPDNADELIREIRNVEGLRQIHLISLLESGEVVDVES